LTSAAGGSISATPAKLILKPSQLWRRTNMARIRTVWPRAQVAHLWANQSQDEARTPQGNFFFDGATVYSYRRSYAIATRSAWRDANGRAIVIMRESPYGKTTSRHFNAVRDALTGHPVRIVT